MATDELTERRRWHRIVTGVLPEVPDPDRAFNELWTHFERPESWIVFDDALHAIHAWTAAGIQIRIGSNFDARLRTVLEGFPDLAPFLDTLLISSEIGYRKPHPRFYQAACESLGLPPERVLCVGDDLENDYRGAYRAGLAAVLLDRDERSPDDPAIATIPDLLALRGPWSQPARPYAP